eukprot:TRINITY_DN1039_c0_g1_i1.p1 TRINITY_DN1039_c0_g1~~TRINITY_DN1039_c0_g1_i1.p1  ORF type:complete len:108 (+),score=17.72 TRINITY_DN1039_c0_g1_i1:68-391(+)
MADTSTKQVQHDPEAGEFYISTGQTHEGRVFLRYKKIKEGVYDFYQTVTPKEQRGKGLAAIVVQAAFEYAREKNWTTVHSCSYVRDYHIKHNGTRGGDQKLAAKANL